MSIQSRVPVENLERRFSFSAYSANSIALARDNLAEVARYRLENDDLVTHQTETMHALGNLVLANLALDETPIVHTFPQSLIDAGADDERSRKFASKYLTLARFRGVAALSHIPLTAPEMIGQWPDRQLDVAAFIREAHALNPDRPESTHFSGNGQPIITGLFRRGIHNSR
jgi:hypothetical protein